MGGFINVKIPDSLGLSLKLENDELEKEIKRLAMIKLYEIGKISSGTASKILEINKIEFLDLLSDYKVCYFDENSINDTL